MVDSFATSGGRHFSAASEGGSALVASGYTSVSGRAGAATVTRRPAVTNTATALADAVKSQLPAVLICGGSVPADCTNLQAIPRREMVLPSRVEFEKMPSTAWRPA